MSEEDEVQKKWDDVERYRKEQEEARKSEMELQNLLGLAERQRDGLQEKVEQLKEHNERLLNEGDMLEKALNKANETIRVHAILVQTKLTRRQQKNYPQWLEEVQEKIKTGPLELKKEFPFPKISMRRLVSAGGSKDDRAALRYLITGLTEKDCIKGFTDAEATDIVEYLNTFPENVVHLKNLDSEFRSDEEEARRRSE